MSSDSPSAARPRTLILATEARLHRDTVGHITAHSATESYAELAEWLDIVDEVYVLARVADHNDSLAFTVEGPGVHVIPVANYRGPLGLARSLPTIARHAGALDRHLAAGTICLGRTPGAISTLLQVKARRANVPFVSHVVGDVAQALPAAFPGRLGRALGWVAHKATRSLVARADGTLYVSQRYLQEKYPPAPGRPSVAQSDVRLSPEDFGARTRNTRTYPERLRVFAAGSQERLYKGHDVLIEACALARRDGWLFDVVLAGTGTSQPQLRRLAADLGVAEQVSFLGHITDRERLRDQLAASDLFAMPSRTEGIPRALIEAMAAGLPAVGSRIGGIPELLDDVALAEPGDPASLLARIRYVAADDRRMISQAERNREVATGLASTKRRDKLASLFDRAQVQHDVPSVLHVLGRLDRGGVEIRLRELIKYLGPADARNSVLETAGSEGSMAPEFRALGAHVVTTDIRRLAFPLALFRTIRAIRPTVVHSYIHFSSAYVLALAWLFRVPVRICHFRTDGDGHFGHETTASRKLVDGCLKALISVFATRIVGLSTDNLTSVWGDRWRGNHKFCVIKNGFDIDYVERLPTETGESAGGRRVVHIGRADMATKNRDGALEVFGKIATQLPGTTLVFIGRDGRDDAECATNRERWSRQIDELSLHGKVLFLGERNDVIKQMAVADLLLFTSLHEGVPGVVIEALAVGTPVLATDLPGCEFVAEELPVELLPWSAGTDAWAEHALRALQNPPTTTSRRAAYERFLGSGFAMSASAQSYLRVWAK